MYPYALSQLTIQLDDNTIALCATLWVAVPHQLFLVRTRHPKYRSVH